MLEYLRIRNLALIEDVELDFTDGMNVLTGETGAGKTFILKAIQFLLGEKLSADMVRAGSQKAQVEAIFYIQGQEHTLRRELLASNGRSRFFLNDDVTSQEHVKELRPSLILHVGQHGQQRLLQPSFQAKLIDDFLENPQILEQKISAQKEWKALQIEKENLIKRIEEIKDKRELLELQQHEIDKVEPLEGEEEKLESIRLQLKSFDFITNAYEEGLEILHGDSSNDGLISLLGQLAKVLDVLNRNQDFEHNVQDAYEALLNFQEEAKDLSARLRTVPSPEMPEDIDAHDIESRLYELAQLKRKLNRSLPDILKLKNEIEENLSFLDACNLDIIRIQKREEQSYQKLLTSVEELNTAREQAATSFCTRLVQELQGLGFSDKVQVQPEFSAHILQKETEQHPACIEKNVRLLWAPNPGQNPQPLDKIASGGELSRFLLAVIGLQQTNSEDATLIFDEVDAGIGGLTLNKVASRLELLAEKRQMLLITHWPQLASKGKNHFLISKEFEEETTFTRCIRLNEQERQNELARMAGQE